jgi:hypothetical protein
MTIPEGWQIVTRETYRKGEPWRFWGAYSDSWCDMGHARYPEWRPDTVYIQRIPEPAETVTREAPEPAYVQDLRDRLERIEAMLR